MAWAKLSAKLAVALTPKFVSSTVNTSADNTLLPSMLGPSSSKIINCPIGISALDTSPSPSVTLTTAEIRPVKSTASSWLLVSNCLIGPYCATLIAPVFGFMRIAKTAGAPMSPALPVISPLDSKKRLIEVPSVVCNPETASVIFSKWVIVAFL
ncbi:hypothetical protein LEPN103867_10150 [Legionella pneumophila subsp. pneumophila]